MADVGTDIPSLLQSNSKRLNFLGRQLLFSEAPVSRLVETYLDNNEGQPQRLEGFPMLRTVYDHSHKNLLLKCSRKTLKSTLLSNVIVINMIRYNHYAQLYVAPQELSTKYFSNNFLSVRMKGLRLARFLQGWERDDVFEKKLRDSESSVLLRYASDDATRLRGPSYAQLLLDEIQDMESDIIPIIEQGMKMLPYKRECFAGTPLTTDNTISVLWERSSQNEWMTKCGCGHWNYLREENKPLEMIQKAGYSCSKCGRVLDTMKGEWVRHNTGDNLLHEGYHLAQPLLPHFNQDPTEWADVYKTVHTGNYSVAQIFNEVFGLAYDVGAKPITKEQLLSLCVLGPMLSPDTGNGGTLETCRRLLVSQKGKYQAFTCGVDWGVNMITSRTTVCVLGIIGENEFDVVFCKVYKDFEYERHIREIAEMANFLNAFCASDSGPSPDRGLKLVEQTSTTRSQLVRYSGVSAVVSRYVVPSGAVDCKQNRWELHKSDTMSIMFDFLRGKIGRLRFPRWDDSAECMQDILHVFQEVRDGLFRQELFYRHKPDLPDDFAHALNFALMQALAITSSSLLSAMSTSGINGAVAPQGD